MDVKYHSLRQAVQEESVHLKYMDTKEHLADVFTKQEGETVPTATPPTAAPTTTPPDDLKEEGSDHECQKCCRFGTDKCWTHSPFICPVCDKRGRTCACNRRKKREERQYWSKIQKANSKGDEVKAALLRKFEANRARVRAGERPSNFNSVACRKVWTPRRWL
jgi:hypothetical protein